MSYEQRDGSGVLFQSKNRKTEKSPNYTGSVTIGGAEYELAGWRKTSGKGTDYLSLQAKPKEAREERQEQPRQVSKPPVDNFEDQEIPF